VWAARWPRAGRCGGWVGARGVRLHERPPHAQLVDPRKTLTGAPNHGHAQGGRAGCGAWGGAWSAHGVCGRGVCAACKARCAGARSWARAAHTRKPPAFFLDTARGGTLPRVLPRARACDGLPSPERAWGGDVCQGAPTTRLPKIWSDSARFRSILTPFPEMGTPIRDENYGQCFAIAIWSYALAPWTPFSSEHLACTDVPRFSITALLQKLHPAEHPEFLPVPTAADMEPARLRPAGKKSKMWEHQCTLNVCWMNTHQAAPPYLKKPQSTADHSFMHCG
jgi:hypothetical protein